MILTRVRSAPARCASWALALKKRLGFKRAAVALARKLASGAPCHVGRPERTSIPTTGSLPGDREERWLDHLRSFSTSPTIGRAKASRRDVERGHSSVSLRPRTRTALQTPWKADPRLPIMRRPCADRGRVS